MTFFIPHLLCCLLLIILLPPGRAAAAAPDRAEWQDAPQVSALFQAAGVTGTFAVYNPIRGQMHGHNPQRAAIRYAPASTFKIPNSLIGFETGAIRDTDEVFPYNGQPQFLKSWEHDMAIGEAIAVSNVTVYQEIARRIGLTTMQEALKHPGVY